MFEAAGIERRCQKRGLVGSFENELGEGLPLPWWTVEVGHGQGRAEGLRHQLILAVRLRDLDILVQSDAKQRPQLVSSFRTRTFQQ